jgi:ornithine decarboxylase
MPGPFYLPESVDEGDYIEIGMLGAYGVAMSTRFNGFGETDTAEVAGRPDGLDVRPGQALDPDPAPEAEERKIVRLSRPKGAARQEAPVVAD